MKTSHLQNGQIKISHTIPTRSTERIPDYPAVFSEAGQGSWRRREVRVGDEGTYTVVGRIYNDDGEFETVSLDTHPEGIPGNMDRSERRIHGWRGTTNDISTYAQGWRRVLSIEQPKRGKGWIVTLSNDLKSTEE